MDTIKYCYIISKKGSLCEIFSSEDTMNTRRIVDILKTLYIYINKSDLLFHVVKHDIMEKLINKCIRFLRELPQISYSR